MSEVLLALGPFQFYMTGQSFQTMKNDAEFRWEPQKRLSRDVAEQFIGPGEQAVEIDAILYPQRFGGDQMPAEMKAAARTGTVMPLIAMSDSGLQADVIGLWVIQRLHSTRSIFDRTGARKIEFTIQLKAYGSDGAGGVGALF